jgi:hypothetical protein
MYIPTTQCAYSYIEAMAIQLRPSVSAYTSGWLNPLHDISRNDKEIPTSKQHGQPSHVLYHRT